MKETLDNHEQHSSNNSEFSSLATMPEFNAEQAKANVNKAKEQLAAKQQKSEATPQSDASLYGLQAITEKPASTPVEELSGKDAAREYLDLLMELSSGFTSPEGKASRVVAKDRDGVERIINGGYSGDSKMTESLLERATSKE